MTELQIQAYVMGELPPEEAALVAEAIAQDPNLAALEQEYKTIKEGFRRQRVLDLQQKTLEYDKSLPPPPIPPSSGGWARGRRFWSAIFASLILLSGVGWVLWQKNYYSNYSIARRYFERPPNPNVASGSDSRTLLLKATDEYFDGNYETAHTRFKELSQGEAFSSSAKLYLPHASFKLNEHERAGTEFFEGLNDENLDLPDLKLLRWNNIVNDIALGKEVITRINAEKWPVAYEADALLKDLDSGWADQ